MRLEKGKMAMNHFKYCPGHSPLGIFRYTVYAEKTRQEVEPAKDARESVQAHAHTFCIGNEPESHSCAECVVHL